MQGSHAGRDRFRDINVTPLVDVMLVLLVVFMITAPLLSVSLPVQLPSVVGTATDMPNELIDLTVQRDGRIFVDGQDASSDPRGAIAAALASGTDRVVVRADADARYEAVATAVAAARDAGAAAIELLVDPEPLPRSG